MSAAAGVPRRPAMSAVARRQRPRTTRGGGSSDAISALETVESGLLGGRLVVVVVADCGVTTCPSWWVPLRANKEEWGQRVIAAPRAYVSRTSVRRGACLSGLHSSWGFMAACANVALACMYVCVAVGRSSRSSGRPRRVRVCLRMPHLARGCGGFATLGRGVRPGGA